MWKEGFGIVLIEALKCGSYCIASDNGGIPEVLNHGKYGDLVKQPNFIEAWVDVINTAFHKLKVENKRNDFEMTEKFELKDWCKSLNSFISDAKRNLITINNNKQQLH